MSLKARSAQCDSNAQFVYNVMSVCINKYNFITPPSPRDLSEVLKRITSIKFEVERFNFPEILKRTKPPPRDCPPMTNLPVGCFRSTPKTD